MNSATVVPRAGFGRRCRAHWQLKLAGIVVGMTAFFAGYLWLLKHPVFAVTTMPLTAIDRSLPFQPAMLAFYVSLWIYVPLVVVLLGDRSELYRHGRACAALALAGFGIFFFWPTAVPVRPNDWAAHPGFAFLQSVDATGNACPSLHVAFAIFSAVVLARVLRELGAARFLRVANWLWCAAIVYSTLATRQHVALDIAGGAALAAVVVGLSGNRSGARATSGLVRSR